MPFHLGGVNSIWEMLFFGGAKKQNRSIVSKFPVHPGAEKRYRAAILVESGVVDELIIQRGVDGFPHFEIVVGFNDLFPAVVQFAVACQDAGAAGLEKFLMGSGQAIHDASQSEGVIGPLPGFAFDTDAGGGGVVHIAEHPGLVLSVAPAQPGKDADVFGDFLFQVQAETVFVAKGRRGVDVCRAGGVVGRSEG